MTLQIAKQTNKEEYKVGKIPIILTLISNNQTINEPFTVVSCGLIKQ